MRYWIILFWNGFYAVSCSSYLLHIFCHVVSCKLWSSIFSLVTSSYILFAYVFVWKHLDVMENVPGAYKFNKFLIWPSSLKYMYSWVLSSAINLFSEVKCIWTVICTVLLAQLCYSYAEYKCCCNCQLFTLYLNENLLRGFFKSFFCHDIFCDLQSYVIVKNLYKILLQGKKFFLYFFIFTKLWYYLVLLFMYHINIIFYF